MLSGCYGYIYSPVAVVNELSQQLNRGLGSVDFLLGHVQVVHEDDGFLAHLRAKHSFTSFVQFGHDDVLRKKTNTKPDVTCQQVYAG